MKEGAERGVAGPRIAKRPEPLTRAGDFRRAGGAAGGGAVTQPATHLHLADYSPWQTAEELEGRIWKRCGADRFLAPDCADKLVGKVLGLD